MTVVLMKPSRLLICAFQSHPLSVFVADCCHARESADELATEGDLLPARYSFQLEAFRGK